MLSLAEGYITCRAVAGAHVWAVGGKVFAIGGQKSGQAAFTFKVSEIHLEMLHDALGLGLRLIWHRAVCNEYSNMKRCKNGQTT
jgi:hypothetical protein